MTKPVYLIELQKNRRRLRNQDRDVGFDTENVSLMKIEHSIAKISLL